MFVYMGEGEGEGEREGEGDMVENIIFEIPFPNKQNIMVKPL